jgi:hypothetical protein
MILVAGTRDWLYSLFFAANEFSATVASDVTKEGRNNFDKTPVFSRALFKQVSSLERAVLYSPS